MLNSFIQGILDDPTDFFRREVFADWLEEQGDWRCHPLRALVHLKQMPWRDGLRPDCHVITTNDVYVSPITGRPRLLYKTILPALLTLKHISCYRGVNSMGRLLGIAGLWQTLWRIAHLTPEQRSEYGEIEPEIKSVCLLHFNDPYNQHPWQNLFQLLARYELYACHLLDVKERDTLIYYPRVKFSREDKKVSWQIADWSQIKYGVVKPVFGPTFYSDWIADPVLKALLMARGGRFGRLVHLLQSCEYLNDKFSARELRDRQDIAGRHVVPAAQWKTAYFRGISLDLLDRFWSLGLVEQAKKAYAAEDKRRRDAHYANRR